MANDSQLFALRDRLSSSAKAQIKRFLGSSISRPIRELYNGVGSVLMYHRITEQNDLSVAWRDQDVFMPNLGLSVSIDQFEEQMRFLWQYTTPISVNEIDSALAAGKQEKPFVVVTFDDGYLDNLQLALPIAEKYKIPFTVFVTTGYIDRTYVPWWYYLEEYLKEHDDLKLPFHDKAEITAKSPLAKNYIFEQMHFAFRQMRIEAQCKSISDLGDQRLFERLREMFLTVEQLKELASNPLVTIGAHTVNHPALSVEEAEDVKMEISGGLDRLEFLLGSRPDTFAYPFGDKAACNLREAEVCQELGLKWSFTTRTGHLFAEHQGEPHLIPRICIDYFDDLNSFARKVSGVGSICENPFSRFVTNG